MKWLLKLIIRYMVWSFFVHHTDLTNATFLRRGTKQRRATDQKPWKWHWLPGYQRMLWKLAIIFGPVMVVWWWVVLTPAARVVSLVFIALSTLAVTVVKVVAWKRGRKHQRAVVAPLQEAVNHVLGEAA